MSAQAAAALRVELAAISVQFEHQRRDLAAQYKQDDASLSERHRRLRAEQYLHADDSLKAERDVGLELAVRRYYEGGEVSLSEAAAALGRSSSALRREYHRDLVPLRARGGQAGRPRG